MLRYDFESSRRLLYSGVIKTWFKAIFGNRKNYLSAELRTTTPTKTLQNFFTCHFSGQDDSDEESAFDPLLADSVFVKVYSLPFLFDKVMNALHVM